MLIKLRRGTTIASVIQIFGRKKCKDTQKATRFFKERRVEFQFVDIDLKGPAPRELDVFAQAAGKDALLDTESRSYRSRGMEYMEFDVLEEIARDPSLLRTPVVREGRRAAVGPDEEFWRALADEAKR